MPDIEVRPDQIEVSPNQITPAPSGTVEVRPDQIEASPDQIETTPAAAPPVRPGNPAAAGPANPVAGGMALSSPVSFDALKVAREGWRNLTNFFTSLGAVNASNPEAGGSSFEMTPDGKTQVKGAKAPALLKKDYPKLANVIEQQPAPTQQDLKSLSDSMEKPIVPISEGLPDSFPAVLKGVAKGVEGLSTPTNLGILASTYGLGTIKSLAQVGLDSVAIRGAITALDAYFAAGMVHGTVQNAQAAYQAYRSGDLDKAAELTGEGSVQGLLAAVGVYHGIQSVREIGRVKIRTSPAPEGPAEPAGVGPAPPPGQGPIIDIQPQPQQPESPTPGAQTSGVGPSIVNSPADYGQPGKFAEHVAPTPPAPPEAPATNHIEVKPEEVTPAAAPESPKLPPINPQSRYANEENPQALYDGTVEHLAGIKDALEDSRTALENPKLWAKAREALTTSIEQSERMIRDLHGELADAFDQSTADRALAEAGIAKPKSPSSTGLKEMGGDMGKAIVGNLYDTLFAKLQKGDLTEAGAPSRVLLAAKPAYDRGEITSPEDFRQWVQDGNYEKAKAPKTEAIASTQEQPGSETQPTETLSYRNKKHHKIDIRLDQDGAGKWGYDSDYTLHGYLGGGHSSFDTRYDTRDEALSAAIRSFRHHIEQVAVRGGSQPEPVKQEAGRMLAWLDSNDPASTAKSDPAIASSPDMAPESGAMSGTEGTEAEPKKTTRPKTEAERFADDVERQTQEYMARGRELMDANDRKGFKALQAEANQWRDGIEKHPLYQEAANLIQNGYTPTPGTEQVETDAPPDKPGTETEAPNAEAEDQGELKPVHEMTLAEFRKDPRSGTVSAKSIFAADPDEPGFWERLAAEKKPTVQGMAQIIGAPHSGSKDTIIERAKNAWELRGLLAQATVDSLTDENKGDQLRELAKRAGVWASGNKRQLAMALIQWRDKTRANSQKTLALWKWNLAIDYAREKGLTIPEHVEADNVRQNMDPRAYEQHLRDKQKELAGAGIASSPEIAPSVEATAAEPKPAPFVYFSGHHNDKLAEAARRRGDIGLMVTPLKPDYLNHATKYPAIAIDNGAFSKAQKFDIQKFWTLLDRAAADPEIKKRVRFVVAPDKPFNWKESLAMFNSTADAIRAKGFPVAFALQDGIEYHQHDIPWDKIDVLFIGGSTEWKTGAHIDTDKQPRAARERWNALWHKAQERGIPIHMGRVNSAMRVDIAEQGIGATSADGTYLAHGPAKNQPQLEKWLDNQNQFGRQTEIDRAEVPDSSQPDEDDYERERKREERERQNEIAPSIEATPEEITPAAEDEPKPESTGTKYVLPSFVTAPHVTPKGATAKPEAKPEVRWLNDDFGNFTVPAAAKLYSQSGRALAPAPKFDDSTSRKRTLSLARQRSWLVSEAQKEAAATGDEHMARLFSVMNPGNYSRSDADTVNDYLFGDADGPSVKSFEKPDTKSDESRHADSESLASPSAETGAVAESEGDTGRGSGQGSGTTRGDLQPSETEGPSSGSSGGTGAGAVDQPGEPATRPGDGRGNLTREVKGNDFRITEADAIGEGTPREKLRTNLDAIRIVKQLAADDGRPATLAEQQKLARYVGWGGLSQIFDEYRTEWSGAREDLREMLTPDEFKAARASTTNAHYTSPDVVRGMWDALQHLGVKANASYLEPSVGVGTFYGLQPDELFPARRTGVELDTITAAIAKALYPESNILHSGFEQVALPENFFDVTIGNFPFGNYGIYDPRYKKEPLATKAIHNYFFVRSLDSVRPGGIVAAITSRYTMDNNAEIRKLISKRAHFLGAIRLPNTTFKGNAGTEVTTDVIFLQKRAEGDAERDLSWLDNGDITLPSGETVSINRYYVDHPEMVLGEHAGGKMNFRGEITVNGQFTPEKFADAVSKLPRGVFREWKAETPAFEGNTFADLGEETKDGGYAIKDGVLVQRVGSVFTPIAPSKAAAERIRAFIPLKQALRSVLKTQLNDEPDAAIVAARKLLNSTYDKFVKAHGPVNAPGNVRALGDDPDFIALSGVEDYDRKEKTATKAAIFRERTIERPKSPEHVDTAAAALAVTLNERGRIEWSRMQELTGKTPDELRGELAGIVFLDPSGRQWLTAEDYLRGNVRQKLAEAKIAAANDPAFRPNVEALEKIQPVDLTPQEIDANLGAAWVPTKHVAQFMREVLDIGTAHVSYEPVVASWNVDVPPQYRDRVANTKTYGTGHFFGHELVTLALNGKIPRVTYEIKVGESTQTVVDAQATAAAQGKLDELKTRFQSWIWEDEQRAKQLAELYNKTYNSLRLTEYDGSHLVLPGSNKAITLRPHQKNAIWRILKSGNTLLAHEVGAGKTWEMCGAAMECRRLGLARKPMIVVPNHMIEQFPNEFMQLYPAARLITITPDDLKKNKRQRALARIAAGNWDAVIIPQSSFGRVDVSDKTYKNFVEEQVAELEAALKAAKAAAHDKAGKRTVKEIEKAKARLLAKLQKRLKREVKDKTTTFEELGVDHLFVDEAHAYKSLPVATRRTRVAGIPNSESDRATDMLMKSTYISKLNGGKRGVVFATGTPITNTMAELYNMQRYLQPQLLKEYGISHFDAWANTFGEVVTGMELDPSATKYRENSRFNTFVNLPELLTAFRMVADVKRQKDMHLPRPDLEGGAMQPLTGASNPHLRAIVAGLVERADAIRGIGYDKDGKQISVEKPKPNEDNMLKIVTEGKKAALDIRLLNSSFPDYPDSKVNRVVQKVIDTWKETAADKGTQVIFCDLSVPLSAKRSATKKPEAAADAEPETSDDGRLADFVPETAGEKTFSVYDDIKAKLIKSGIPAKEIAFIHDYGTGEEKQELFDQVNAGKVRVVLGSTEKMGVGTNLQKRAAALYHLDTPWRPADIEQRNGRILRQGNQYKSVRIYQGLTEGSFDAYSWQLLENKARFIEQAMSGDTSIRRMEDVGMVIPSAAEFKAIASGSPLVREKVTVDAQLAKLDLQRSAFVAAQSATRWQIAQLPEQLAYDRRAIKAAEKDVATYTSTEPVWTIGKRQFAGEGSRALAADALAKALDSWRDTMTPVQVGSYRGFDLWTAPQQLKGTSGQHWFPNLTVRGAREYAAYGNEESPIGTISSIESQLRNLPDRVQQAHDTLAEHTKKLTDLEAEAEKAWPKQAEYDKLKTRKRDIDGQLAASAAEKAATSANDPDAESPDDEEGAVSSRDAGGNVSIHNAAEAKASFANSYKPGKGTLPEDDHTWFSGAVDGEKVYSNGHFLAAGEHEGTSREMPAAATEKYWTRSEGEKQVTPVSIQKHKTFTTVVFLSDGTAINSEYYDYLNAQFPGSELFHESAPDKDGIQEGPVRWIQDGKQRALLLPMRVKPEGAAEALLKRRQTQSGAIPLAAFLRKDTGEPERTYSGLGAFKSRLVRNLSQLEEVSPEAHKAAVQAAAYRAQSAVLMRSAWRKVGDALGNMPGNTFRLALIESRLQGIEQRWRELAASTQHVDGNDLLDWVLQGPIQLLDAMSPDAEPGEPGTLAQQAAGLAGNLAVLPKAKWNRQATARLRTLVSGAFEDAADRVHHMMDADEFDHITESPEFLRGLGVYKRDIEAPLAKSHEDNEGVFSSALGPLDTYYPLTPIRAEDQAAKILGIRRGFKKPKNLNNRFATGLAEDYDPSLEAFKEKAEAAIRANDKAALIDALYAEGIIRKLQPGEKADTMMFRGREFTAFVHSVGPARTITTEGGKVIQLPEQRAVVPEPFYHELLPILEPNRRIPQGAVRKIIDILNNFTLSGPAEVAYHAHNIIGSLVSNTPFLGDDLLTKTIGNTPVTKIFTAIGKLIATDPMDARATRDLREMAQLGLLPERFGSETYSRRYAEATGAEKKLPILNWGPLLYGPKGLDVRARLLMFRLAKEINPGASSIEIYKFVNQLGNYTEALQAHFERAAKRTGFSRFYTAGSTMLRNGLDAWIGTGSGSGPGGGKGNRIAQMLSGGAIGLIAAWAVAYKAATGKWPWEDHRAKLLKIPASDALRRSRAGIALWGHDVRKVGYINFGVLSPLVNRGAHALGVDGAANTAIEGGTWKQDAQAAKRDIANSLIHPVAGPVARGVFVGVTGKQPYLVQDADRGGSTFLPALGKKSRNGSELLSAAKQLNSFYGNVGAATGLLPNEDAKATWDEQLLKTLIDLTGISGGASNPNAARQALARDRRNHK